MQGGSLWILYLCLSVFSKASANELLSIPTLKTEFINTFTDSHLLAYEEVSTCGEGDGAIRLGRIRYIFKGDLPKEEAATAKISVRYGEYFFNPEVKTLYFVNVGTSKSYEVEVPYSQICPPAVAEASGGTCSLNALQWGAVSGFKGLPKPRTSCF